MATLDPKDPRNVPGAAPEQSDRKVSTGVYVFQPKNEQDEVVGEKKYLEASDPVHAEAFLAAGWRGATEEETKEYRKRVEEARKSSRTELLEDEARRREQIAGLTGRAATEEEVSGKETPKAEQTEAKTSKKENK